MGRFVQALILTLLLAVVLVSCTVTAVENYFQDPARIEAQRQAAALALQRQAEESAWWRDVREALKPFVIVGGGVVALAAGFGAAGGLGLFLARQWDERQKRRRTYTPDKRGLLPVTDQALDQVAALALAGHWQAQVTAAQHPQIPASVTRYADQRRYVEGRTGAAPSAPASLPMGEPAPLALPGPVDLGNVLAGPPTLDRVLIGLGPGGHPIQVSARDLCHVALTGATGGGKSNLMRLLLAQLLAAGARVVLADPHYAPLDPDDPTTGDWRPIEARLFSPPAVTATEIADLLSYIDQALTDRLELRRQGERLGPPVFLALDELPSINATVNGAADVLGRVVREGRKVGVLTVSSAQDFLVKTIGGSGAARDNFRTAFYTGGDQTSARVLLDVRGRIEEPPGKGLVMLRSAATPTATMTRVPLVSDATLRRLLPAPRWSDSDGLGRSDGSRTAESGPIEDVSTDRPGPTATDRPPFRVLKPRTLVEKAAAVEIELSESDWRDLETMDKGETPQAIAARETGSTEGRPYRRRRDELIRLADMVRAWPTEDRAAEGD